MKTSKIKTTDKITCLKCDRSKSQTNYYINTNPLFLSEKLCVCKVCINDFIGLKDTPGYLDRVKLVLGLMNKPFLYDTWMSSEEDWAKYIPQISSLPHNKAMTLANSDHFGSIVKTANNDYSQYSVEQVTLSDTECKQLEIQWGKKLEVEDYLFLENEFEALVNSYECDSYAQQMLFQEIAHKRLEIKKNREANKSTEKEVKTLQELLTSSNIKPVQETGANAVEQATFGTLIKKYENEKPIPEPDPEWRDVDGIKKYISVWFLGHLCRMLGIKNEYSRMYEEEIAKYQVEAPTYEQDDESVTT